VKIIVVTEIRRVGNYSKSAPDVTPGLHHCLKSYISISIWAVPSTRAITDRRAVRAQKAPALFLSWSCSKGVRTLRHQNPITKVSLTFRSVPKCLGHFGTGAELSVRHFGTGVEVSETFLHRSKCKAYLRNGVPKLSDEIRCLHERET